MVDWLERYENYKHGRQIGRQWLEPTFTARCSLLIGGHGFGPLYPRVRLYLIRLERACGSSWVAQARPANVVRYLQARGSGCHPYPLL